MVCSIIKYTR